MSVAREAFREALIFSLFLLSPVILYMIGIIVKYYHEKLNERRNSHVHRKAA